MMHNCTPVYTSKIFDVYESWIYTDSPVNSHAREAARQNIYIDVSQFYVSLYVKFFDVRQIFPRTLHILCYYTGVGFLTRVEHTLPQL